MVTEHIKVNKARCRLCDATVTSKHRHDYVSCTCGAIAVDGGKDYLRRAAKDLQLIVELSEYYTKEEWIKELEWRNSPKYKELLEQRQHELMMAVATRNG